MALHLCHPSRLHEMWRVSYLDQRGSLRSPSVSLSTCGQHSISANLEQELQHQATLRASRTNQLRATFVDLRKWTTRRQGGWFQASRLLHVTASRDDSTTPASSCSEAVSQARSALRQARTALKNSLLAQEGSRSRSSSGSEPDGGAGSELESGLEPRALTRLVVELPIPVPGSDELRELRDSDWPGGIQQRFYALQPLVTDLLAGYNAEFAGFLSKEDGLGVWKAEGMTVLTFASNAAFAEVRGLFKQIEAQQDRSHTVLLVNPLWTSASAVGQLWDWRLRSEAERIIERGNWTTLYSLEVVRTTKGNRGLVGWRYPSPYWSVYAMHEGVPSKCFLRRTAKPSSQTVADALSQAAPASGSSSSPKSVLQKLLDQLPR